VLRFFLLGTLVLVGAVAVLAAAIGGAGWWLLAAVVAVLLLIGLYDVIQKNHSILRNYPILGHMRFLLEEIRP
jgi:hypothetical protein